MAKRLGVAVAKQEQACSTILSDLYQGTFEDAAWDRGLLGLARLVGSESLSLISVNPMAEQLLRSHYCNIDSGAAREYEQVWLARDVRVPALYQYQEGELLTPARIFKRGEWERTEVFNDFCRENGCAWTIHALLHKRPHKFTGLNIQATRSRGSFSPDDVELVRPLMPHVRRALEIKDRLEQQNLRANTLRDVVNQLSFGILILDERQKIIEASSFAVDSLQTVCLSAPRPGQELKLRPPADRQLRLLLSTSLTSGPLSNGLLHFHRGREQLPLSLLVAPAPMALQSWMLDAPHWLLFVFDPEQRLAPAAALIERDLGLSPREAQIASLLAMGMHPQQIASRLCISRHTLRAHLKASLAKTECHTQAELVRRMMTSPAWLRMHKHDP